MTGIRSRLPRLFIALGLILMAAGLSAAVALLIAQDHCQHVQLGEYSAVAAACMTYRSGANWGYLVVALGAAAVVAGSIVSTDLVQRTRRTPSAE